jgi:hypothetical protein
MGRSLIANESFLKRTNLWEDAEKDDGEPYGNVMDGIHPVSVDELCEGEG